MKKRTIGLLSILGLATVLFAFGPSGHQTQGFYVEGKHASMFKLLRKLDLTSEQRTKLQLVRDSQKSLMQEQRETFQNNRESMMKQMRPDMSLFVSAENFDKKVFKEEMIKKFKLRNKAMETKSIAMMENRASNLEKVFNILTPQQRVEWVKQSKEL